MSSIVPSIGGVAGRDAPEELPATEIASLGQRARRAVFWNTAFNIFRDINQFVVMIVLVRLLPASDYGEFNLTNTIIGFVTVASLGTFLTHTLQIKKDEDVDYHLHFTIGGVIQLALFALTNVVAVLLRRSPTYSAIGTLVHVMSATFVLEWPTQLRLKMLERDLDWKRKSILHGIGLIASALLAIIMAHLGAGVYALLVPGMLVTLPFIIDLFIVQRWHPEWRLSWHAYAPAFRFGLKRMSGAMLEKGRLLAESSMITALVGFAALGHFGRAVGLGQLICYKLATQLMYSLYPALARMEPRSAGFQRTAGLVLRSVGWFAIPTATLFSLLAGPVVMALYGPRWQSVIPMLGPALAVAAVSSLYHVSYMLLLAHLRVGWCLALDLLLNLSIVILLVVVLPAGLQTYLQSLALTYAAVLSLSVSLLVRDRGITWSGAGVAMLPPLGAALTAGVACAWVVGATGHLPPLISCVLTGTLFGLLYLFLLRVTFRAALQELVSYLPGARIARRALMLAPNSVSPVTFS